MRYLGIDYGDKKIGLAIGDDETRIASPFDVIRNTGEGSLLRLVELIAEEDLGAIVVGVPLNEGEFHNSDQLDKTRGFISLLKAHVQVPIHEEDERYTTAESQRLQKEYGSTAEEDALAAMLVLQAYLDRR